MAKMNYKQIEHCQARLDKLRGSKIGECPEKPEDLDVTVVMKEIYTGERRISSAQLRAACEAYLQSGGGYRRDHLEDLLVEAIYKKENAKALIIYEDRAAKFKALCKRVDGEITRITDEIVLGDQQAAMGLIASFEAWKP